MLLFVLVRTDFEQLAYIMVVLSKWRMFVVRPRHWPASLRANAIDLIVGLAFVAFMVNAPSQAWQFAWAGLYGCWLLFIKPRSTTFWIVIQAMVGQLLGLMGLYLIWGTASLLILVIASWLICYLAARHFLSGFDEVYNSFLAHVWGFFGAALTWILGHWLLYYGVVAQPTLLLCVIGYGFGVLYYLHDNDSLSQLVRREILLIITAVILVVVMFSDWGDKAI